MGKLVAKMSYTKMLNMYQFFIICCSGKYFIALILQAKFMPNSNDMSVVSCARDGQVDSRMF